MISISEFLANKMQNLNIENSPEDSQFKISSKGENKESLIISLSYGTLKRDDANPNPS
jgi:hypothetical protein